MTYWKPKRAATNEGVISKISENFFVHLALLVVYCLVVFPRIGGYLTRTYDIRYQASLIDQAFRSREFSFGVGNNFLHGLGNIDFNIQQLLIPSHFLSRAFTNEVNFTALFMVASVELFATVFFLAKTLRLSHKSCLLSAWMLPVLAFGWTEIKIGNLYWMQPDYSHAISLFAVQLALFLRVGRGSRRDTVFNTFWMLFIFVWLLLSQPTELLLFIPVFAVFGAMFLILQSESKTRPILRRYAISLGSVTAVLGATGLLSYLFGLVEYTIGATREFGLFNDRNDRRFISGFLFGYRVDRLLLFSGLLSLFWLSRRNRLMRFLAMSTLVSFVLIWLYGFINIHSKIEIGPSASYFEHFLIPTLILGISTAVVSISETISRLSRVIHFNIIYFPIILFVIVGYWILRTQGPEFESSQSSFYPPKEVEVVRYLRDNAGLYENSEFRGRVLTLKVPGISVAKRPESAWEAIHKMDSFINGDSGNDLNNTGIHYFGVPHLLEYSQYITPPFFEFANHFLTLKDDLQIRLTIVMRRVNIPIWRLIGVRFLITDEPQVGLQLRMTKDLTDSYKVYLYEIDDVNLGTYSPTNVLRHEKLEGQFALMDKVGFDSRNDVVVAEDIGASFVPAANPQMKVVNGDVHITAKSSGTSLLVLPLEYSRCFDVDNRIANSKIKLFRADTLLTGIKFDRVLDAVLTFRTGPFHNSTCRIQDLHDYQSAR